MRIHAFVFAALVLLTVPAPAQKRAETKKEPTFSEAVEQARKAVDAKEYGAAVSALQAAIRAVQKVQRVAILAALPKPEGFEIRDEEAKDIEAEPFGVSAAALGLTVNRRYSRGEKSIDVEVTANSPLIQMYSIMFSNPAVVKADGGEIVTYERHKAILKPGEEGFVELTILMHDRHLVKVSADGLTVDELLAVFDQATVDRLEKPLGK